MFGEVKFHVESPGQDIHVVVKIKQKLPGLLDVEISKKWNSAEGNYKH